MVGLETIQEQQPSRNKGQWMEKGEPGRRAIATTTIITITTIIYITTIIITTITITIITITIIINIITIIIRAIFVMLRSALFLFPRYQSQSEEPRGKITSQVDNAKSPPQL